MAIEDNTVRVLIQYVNFTPYSSNVFMNDKSHSLSTKIDGNKMGVDFLANI